ncbi:glucose-6-phosphate isomerase, partial [Chloroflexota bacterium]
WEFATAVVGAILGIHPFNQPDVQNAKDRTQRLLREYTVAGCLPQVETTGSIVDLLTQARKGNYLAIMAYLRQTPEVDEALAKLRQSVVAHHHIATTIGYGPRFLHSTGQLHKGGPNTGLFLQITASHENALQIPGQPYTFGVIADAEALGDLEALRVLGRLVTRIHFSRGDGAAITKLGYNLRCREPS